MKCKRIENKEWGTVDYVDAESQNGNIVFRTIPEVRHAFINFKHGKKQ